MKASRTREERRWAVRIDNWHPARLNQLLSGHWGKAYKLKRFDKDIVAVCCRAAGVTKASGRRRVGLTIILGPRQRGGDPDCWWKSLLDALTACGALRGDSKEWVQLAGPEYERGPQKAAVIYLEELT